MMEKSMTNRPRGVATLTLLAALAAAPASADGFLGLDIDGSLGDGGFARYVPPVTNPLFNETPFITTEAKPIYIYHHIPDDFLTSGGSVNVVALQARLAITERLGFIATADGYSFIDFDSGLEDDDGFNDIAAGLKYAVISDPAAGQIATVGVRYTAPVGTLESNGLEFNGVGDGYIDVFATGAKLFEKAQLQGSVGTQIALSNKNVGFLHASLHGDYEILPGFFPLIESNLTVPIQDGNRLKGVNLTGVDIIDLGSDDPETVLTLAFGARYRFSDNVLFGAAFEKNLLENDITGTSGTEASAFGWRVTTDLTIHF
jgi:hypothetical protein